MIACWIGGLIVCLAVCLNVCLLDWLIVCLIGCLAACLIDWLMGWLDCPIGRLIDSGYVIDCVIG